MIKEKRKILLVGNPNVGKSSLFYLLSGHYVDVSNYPGTTVDVTSSNISDEVVLIDTPGTYDVSEQNPESTITKQELMNLSEQDLVVNVCNAGTLEKDLFLTLHLIDLGIPFVLVLNQVDVLEAQNTLIDYQRIGELLGVPVIPCSTITSQGVQELKEIITNDDYTFLASSGNQSPALGQLVSEIDCQSSLDKAEKILWLEQNISVIDKVQQSPPVHLKKKIYEMRRSRADKVVSHSTKYYSEGTSKFLKTLNNLLIHPVWGYCIAFILSWLFLYQILGVMVAGNLVDFVENSVLNAYYTPLVKNFVGMLFPIAGGDLLDMSVLWQDPWEGFLTSIGTILAGEYGVLTLMVTYLFGLLLPLIWFFYGSWALLEDTGYLPRLSALTHSLLEKIGLNGRGIIPLVLGLGCVTMAIVTTRLMNNRRDQLILMILLSIAIPCSAQLGIIQGLLAKMGGFTGWLIWFGVILLVLLVSGFVANIIMPGSSQPIILDLPPLRMPRLFNVIKKTNQKTYFFLRESGVAFFWASVIVCICQVSGLLNLIIQGFEPIAEGLLHLPKEIALSFLLGMVRRDFGAFGLLDLDLSVVQVITASVSLTLFVPCIATLGMIAKERNIQTSLAIWSLSWFLGIGGGAILTRILEYTQVLN